MGEGWERPLRSPVVEGEPQCRPWRLPKGPPLHHCPISFGAWVTLSAEHAEKLVVWRTFSTTQPTTEKAVVWSAVRARGSALDTLGHALHRDRPGRSRYKGIPGRHPLREHTPLPEPSVGSALTPSPPPPPGLLFDNSAPPGGGGVGGGDPVRSVCSFFAKGADGNVTEERFVLTFVALRPCAGQRTQHLRPTAGGPPPPPLQVAGQFCPRPSANQEFSVAPSTPVKKFASALLEPLKPQHS